MNSVDELFRRLNQGDDIGPIRCDVAQLLEQQLRAAKDSFGYWEKMCFAMAVASLHKNLVPRDPPVSVWLRACLVNIHKASIPSSKRNSEYVPERDDLSSLTYEQLIQDVAHLKNLACGNE